jgi:hypothetical protein
MTEETRTDEPDDADDAEGQVLHRRGVDGSDDTQGQVLHGRGLDESDDTEGQQVKRLGTSRSHRAEDPGDGGDGEDQNTDT